jgi:hypothetical protein
MTSHLSTKQPRCSRPRPPSRSHLAEVGRAGASKERLARDIALVVSGTPAWSLLLLLAACGGGSNKADPAADSRAGGDVVADAGADAKAGVDLVPDAGAEVVADASDDQTPVVVMCGPVFGDATGGSSNAPDFTDWTGGTWTGSQSYTQTCNGSSSTLNGGYSATFAEVGQGVISVASSSGCPSMLCVSGDTATLAAAPVTCSDLTYTAYTLTTSDGVHLSGTASGTLTVQGYACTFTVTIDAQR